MNVKPEEFDRLLSLMIQTQKAIESGDRMPAIAVRAEVDEAKMKTVAWCMSELCPNCKQWPTFGNMQEALGIVGDGTALIHCIRCGAVLRVRQTVMVRHSIEQLEVTE